MATQSTLSAPRQQAGAETALTEHQNAVAQWIAMFNDLENGLHKGLLEQLAHPDIRFVDPFNDVQGHDKVRHVLAHFAHTVRDIHFEVTDTAWSTPQRCFLRWRFSGQLPRSGEWSFIGVTQLELDSSGRITLHQDYWDAAQHFYMRLPLIGRIMRWLRNRIADQG